MSLPSSPPLEPDLASEVRRLADRLRSLGPARLARAFAPYASAADAGHAVAQELADLALELTEPGTPRRIVPRLTDAAVGDQVAVTGREMLDAVDASTEPAEAARASIRAIERLRDLRLAL